LNTASGFLLYLAGSFALVIATILIPALEYYTGAFVIFLFMGGLFYSWLNAIRQANKIPKEQQRAEEGSGREEEEGETPSRASASDSAAAITDVESPAPPLSGALRRMRARQT